ncbi:MAG: anion permease [Anaerolineae bacterium]|nr:anion permease [Anaerolineae bacterium]
MTFEIGFVLAVILAAVILFATEKLRVDIIALLVLLTLALSGIVSPTEAFSGFSSPAVITVWAVYIVSAGLFKTGVADILGQKIIKIAGKSEPRLVAAIMLTCGIMSAFMNNIGATAVLLPAVVGISRQAKIPLSRLLIPLSFSSLMGGNMTLIGTPPNVLASSMLTQRGLPTFSFFDFTPLGAIIFAAGILYMVLIGRHLLPKNESLEKASLSRLREYISEIRIPAESSLVGKTLNQSQLGAQYDLSVLSILRRDKVKVLPLPDILIRAEDLLTVEGTVEQLLKAKEQLGVQIESERKLNIVDVLDNEDNHIFEATLSPRAPFVGKTLREILFRDRYGFTTLAIWRQGEVITERLRDVRLKFGDTLLLQGSRRRIGAMQKSGDFLVLEPVTLEERRKDKIFLAIGISALVLGLVTVGGFNIATAMLIGAVSMVLTGCLNMDEAYQSIEWRSVFLIAGMLPLGIAMETTGTARFLAENIVSLLGGFGPLAILAGLTLFAGLVTEPMSNAAATVLIVPIAIDIALGLGASPQAFVMATIIGASTSFLTPVGHQANVLVMGPGGYRFFDYTRVGFWLNLLILGLVVLLLPLFWPLF